jgi:beta-lactamase superfamily II metal-dependent hydrolase
MPGYRLPRVDTHVLWAALPALLSLLVARPAEAVFTNGKLQIVHLDAGQGDGAVLITPGGQVALFDEGTNFTVGTSGPSCARVLSELQALGVTHVDLHFASHYHADHIGCITGLTGITIDAGWDRAQSYTSATYTAYTNYLGTKRHTVTKSQVWTLDSLSAHPVTIKCIAFGGDGITTSDENSKCAVYKISYGEFDEEIGGDLTGYPSGTSSSNTNIETKVGPQVGKVEVYKVHHHGSAYASYDDWLNATQPKIGIVSCGTGNTYGHPTFAALNRLHNHGVHTYWTEQGSGAAPTAGWDKVANGQIAIYAVWQPGGIDSILAAPAIADTFSNSGTAVDAIAPLVALVTPNGGETLAAGGSAPINWTATDNVGVTTVDVDYSTDEGDSWTNVVAGAPNTGSLTWNVPNLPTSFALVRVTAHDGAGNTGVASSGGDFTIADLTAPVVAVTTPHAGDSYLTSSQQSVTWTASDNVGVDSVNVDYSVNGAGGPWQPVEHGLANSGTVQWTLPDAPTDSALVMVTAFDHALNQSSGTNDGLFQIQQDLTGVGGGVARFALYPAVPSPSVGGTQLRFSLATPGPAALEVFDLAGRLVWSLNQASLGAGEHAINWPAVSDRGVPVGAGIYFVRLSSRQRNTTIKFILLR